MSVETGEIVILFNYCTLLYQECWVFWHHLTCSFLHIVLERS